MRALAIISLLLAAALTAPTVEAAGSGQVGGRVVVFPALVTFTVSPLSTKAGQNAQAQATVVNAGRTILTNVHIDLRIDPAGLKGPKTGQVISQIKPGKSATVSWLVCGRTAGSYVLLVHVTLGTMAIDSVARILTVTPGTKGCP